MSLRKFWNLAQGERNVLEIMHEIDSSDWWGEGEVVTATAFRRELSQCTGELAVLINSPGGDTFAAADIYTALREYSQSRGRVTCYITGIAASAASLIAVAGDVVRISNVGMMMIHDPWTVTIGNAGELREMADVLDTVRDAVAAAYVAKTHKSAAEIREMMARTSYMTADQAISEGFADEIGVYDGPPRARAMDNERTIGEGELSTMLESAKRMRDCIFRETGSQADDHERIAMRLRVQCV